MDLIAEAGWPPGLVNLVCGGRAAAERLIAHPGVDAVTLSGSPVFSTGFAIVSRAGLANLNGNTFSGSSGASSPRYSATANGVIFSCSSMFQALGNTWPTITSSAIRVAIFAVPVLWLSTLPDFRIVDVWYVSLASILAAIMLPLAVYWLHPERRHLIWLFALLSVAVIVLHRANISRLVAGTEHRFGRRRGAESDSAR